MMNLTSTQNRTPSGRSYDDTGNVPADQSAAKGQVTTLKHSAPSSVKLTHSASQKTLNTRVISQSRQGLEEQLDELMAIYDKNGLERQETAILHPYGILGQMSEDYPEFASALINQRLKELKADAATWWNSAGREHANQQIALMNQLLASGQYEELFALLVKLEKDNKKISFCQIMNAKFLDPDNHKATPLFKPFKNEGWFSNLCTAILSDLQKTEAIADVAAAFHRLQQSFDELQHRNAGNIRSPKDLTKYMLLSEPDPVREYMKSQCGYRLQELRLKLKDTSQSLTDSERAEVKVLSSQLQQLGRATHRKELQAFLADPANAELNKALENALVDVYLQQLQHRIVHADYATMNKAQLHKMVKSSQLFKELMATYKAAQVLSEEEQEALAAMDKAVKNFERAEELHRILDSEQHKPVNKRLFALNIPSIQRLMEKLANNANDTETQLYTTMESLFKAEADFHANRSDANLITLQKVRFDARRLQQEQAEFEIRARLKGQDGLVVLTSGDYDKDVERLKTIHSIRQKFTPVRPAGSHTEGVYRLARRVFWDKERPFPQILADLEQAKTLQKLGYSAEEEFLQLLKDIDGLDGATIKQAASNIAAPGSQLWQDWQAGKASFLQVLRLPGQSYRALEQEARNIITSALQVAERNPEQFRRLFGDISLIMDQLQSLLGPDSAGLLTQLQNAARAHSMASCFAGDEAVLEEVDPDSDLAKHIKRFQLLCDMAAYTMHTTTALNFVKNVMTGTAAGICGTTAGFIGGLLTFGAAAPACAAIGTAIGTALTVGKAALRAGGTYAIREGLNSLDGEQVRLLDKIVNHGPLFLTATSPYDTIATGLRHFGKGDSLPTAMARTVLGPVLTPFKNMYKAIKGIYHGEDGAWKKLGIELAVATSAIALTAALGATLYATGFAVILGSPVLGATLSALIFSHGFFQLVNRVRTLGSSVYSSIQHYQQAMFNSGNPMVKQIRTECEKEARTLVARMMDRDLYYQRIQEEKMKELYNTHWKRWSEAHSAEALTHVQAVARQLQETEQSRRQLAAQIADSVKVLNVLEEGIKNAAEITRSDEKLRALKAELAKVGIEPGRTNRAALALTLQTLKEEQLSIIERQCGTITPGESEEAILDTLNEHYRTIILGSKIPDLLELSARNERKAEKKARKRVVKAAEATAVRHYEERARLMLVAGLTKAAETQLEADTGLTEEAMKKPAVINAAIAELTNQKQLLKDTVEAQANRYEGLFSKASELSGTAARGLLNRTNWAFAPQMMAF